MLDHVHSVFALPGSPLGRRLILAYLATLADTEGRCRVLPTQVAHATSVPATRVDGEIADLDRAGLIHAVRWNDTGAWSITLTLPPAPIPARHQRRHATRNPYKRHTTRPLRDHHTDLTTDDAADADTVQEQP